jgi:carbamoyltransferase
MPFAPIIIKEHQKKYFNNSKKISCDFMTISFDTLKNKNYKHIVAASHLRDKTIRPQLLDKESNSDLYQILKKFYKITGMSGLINTSFNLHGYPIVNSPADAIEVFFKSGLDYLVLNNFIIKK